MKVLLAIAFVSVAVPLATHANAPAWWATRGVLTSGATADDYAAVNQGQVKHMATQAAMELEARLPGGAGPAVWTLVNGFANDNNYVVANLGQFKNVAKPFYDRLMAAGYTNAYPWSVATADDDDYAAANIGQLKNLFSWDLESWLALDTDGDGIPDSWEIAHNLDPLMDSASDDPDNDGLDNFSEFLLNWDPHDSDTNNNGIPDGEEDLGLPPGTPSYGSSTTPTEPSGSTIQRPPVDPADTDNDGWSDDDDSAPDDPEAGPSPSLDVDFFATSNTQFESYRPLLERTVTGRTYIYKVSGTVNYWNTQSGGRFKDYAYVLDEGNYPEAALLWLHTPTLLDLDAGQPASDHVYYLIQNGDGGPQTVRPYDICNGDNWSPGGGGPNGVCDSYEDNTGNLSVEVYRPKIRVVEYDPHDATWPGVEPVWISFPSIGRLYTGRDARFEVDLGADKLNNAISSVTWTMSVQDGPGSVTQNGSSVSGNVRRGQFVNLTPAGRVRVIANVELSSGQSIFVDDFLEVGIRTKSITVIQWVDGGAINPSAPLRDVILWSMRKAGLIPSFPGLGTWQPPQPDQVYFLAMAEHMLRSAPDTPPNASTSFQFPQRIDEFFNNPDSKFRLGLSYRVNFHPKKDGSGWVLGDDNDTIVPTSDAHVGGTQLPDFVDFVPRVLREWFRHTIVMKPEPHKNNGVRRENQNSGNVRTRLTAAARAGLVVQELTHMLLGQELPWIYSNTTFDASKADGQPVDYPPPMSIFPTGYVYVEGEWMQNDSWAQKTVEEFLQTVNISLPSTDP